MKSISHTQQSTINNQTKTNWAPGAVWNHLLHECDICKCMTWLKYHNSFQTIGSTFIVLFCFCSRWYLQKCYMLSVCHAYIWKFSTQSLLQSLPINFHNYWFHKNDNYPRIKIYGFRFYAHKKISNHFIKDKHLMEKCLKHLVETYKWWK